MIAHRLAFLCGALFAIAGCSRTALESPRVDSHDEMLGILAEAKATRSSDPVFGDTDLREY